MTENALFCMTKTIDRVMTSEIESADLIITKYKNIFPHVAAAIQMSNINGKPPSRGEVIRYIYTDSQHQNPLHRIVAVGDSYNNSGLLYDKEKCKEMLLDVT